MSFGDYIKELRTSRDLSQRDVAELSKVSNTEISRIESGERKMPTPKILKAIAPHLGTSYENLMSKAGYIEETVDHNTYMEIVYKDENGSVVDIIKQVKEMFEKDPIWTTMAYRVLNELPIEDIEVIKAVAKNMLEKNKK